MEQKFCGDKVFFPDVAMMTATAIRKMQENSKLLFVSIFESVLFVHVPIRPFTSLHFEDLKNYPSRA